MFGGTASKDYVLSFPSSVKLEETPLCALAQIKLIEYDVGTHIRCVRITMTDGTASEKIGGFDLKKTMDFTGKEINKVVMHRFKNDT